MTYAVTISGNNISLSMAAVEYSVSLSQSGLQGTPGKGIVSSAYNDATGILTITYTDATTETLDLSGIVASEAAAAAAAAAASASQVAADASATAAAASALSAAENAMPNGGEILFPIADAIPTGWYDTGSRLLSGVSERAILSNDVRWNYAANWKRPSLVLDATSDRYILDGAVSTFPDTLTHTRAGNATVLDADGVLKWAPHNLVLNSATPATQSITVASGADYTVECTGSGSVTLSGAGTGTVSEGTPVEVTASTTTLTLTVSGTVDLMWAYRSDLGGMQAVPTDERGLASSSTYLPTTSAARYLPRRNAYTYVDGVLTGPYLQLESAAATNLLHNTDALVTQTETVTAQPYTLHFTGTGTVTLSGASTAGPLVGTGTGENNRVSLTFTPTAGTLTLTVSGTVTNAQLEAGSIPTSYIPNLAASGSVSRAAETLTIPTPPWPSGSPGSRGLAIAMDGLMTYADTGGSAEATFIRWVSDTNNEIRVLLQTFDTDVGQIVFLQDQTAYTQIEVSSAADAYSPGINVPFSIASRHGDNFVNGAVDGTALTAKLTSTILPDLSSTPIQIGSAFNGYIDTLRIWDEDIGDAGIEEASQ